MRAAFLALTLFAAGCPADPVPPTPPAVDDGVGAMAPSSRGKLLWKRGPALARGLADALVMPVEDVCQELGRLDCFGDAHQVPLGGNDAFVRGQYEPLAQPGSTTSVAFDRVVLAACSQAVEFDLARPTTIVFRGHALTDTPLDPSSDDVIEGVHVLGQTLTQRLHGRDAQISELAALEELLTDDEGRGVSGKDFAKLACFAVAATSETLFY